MSEYSSLINSYANAAPTQAATSAEDSPDDAARSLELSQATSVPAPAIFGDLDQFEAKHKSMLAANIVANNPKLREYVNSHPLAASVSNDDWGNLDAFSQGAQQTNRIFSALQSKNPVEGAFGGAIQGFQEGFGPGGFSPEVARRTNPATAPGGWLGAQAGLLTYGIGELALRTMSGIMGAASGAARGAGTAVGGPQLGREAGAITEYEMTKGEGRPEVQAQLTQGMRGRLEYDQASQDFAQAQVQAKNNSVMHWIGNGREPPRGIDPQIDAAKAQINAQALERLDEDLAAAQASSTKERSPEMFRRFVDQHYGNSTISISGDAAAALYGDKPPAPNDGLLGFVPGMADQLALARTTGADVHIPVADWIANVDPAVAKGLHDDLRVWPGGITAREAKETIEPKVIVDSPLAQERGAYELEPMFSMGDRKLQLSKSGEPLGPGGIEDERIDHYQILDDKGQPVGQLRIGRGDDRELLVDWVGGQAGLWSNSFGPSLIRDLLRQIKALYPDYDYLTGYRISGARDVAGAPDELRVPRVRLDAPEGWDKVETKNEFQDARDILNAAYWQDFGRGIKGAMGPLSLDQQMLADRIGTELDRMSGGRLNFKAVTGITRQKGGLPQGVYLHDQHNPLALIDMFGPDPLGSGRHELAHFLKNSGLLTPEEWDTLATAANQEGWHERYNIDERYPGASASLRDEEAVVSAFQEWNKAGRPVGSNTAGIFQKIWELFDRLRQKLFGKESTWEDIFQKMKSGEVGAREFPPESGMDIQPRFSIDDMDQLRANGVGLDLQSFRRIQEAVRRRYEADLEAATNRAQREQSKTQTKEWKSNQADIRRDVEATIRQRPDVAADLFIGSGELYGQKLRQRYTLRESDLSPEQKAALPEHYVSKNGLPPDEVARLFGYGSGDQMVEGLAGYNAIKGTLSPQKALEKIVDAETERQMQAKYGNLGVNIVDEARDQALSETDQDLVAEELQAWAMQTGQQVVDKVAVQAAARDAFAKMPLGSVSSQSLMNNVAKYRREAIQLLATQDPAALVSMQRAQFSMALAAEAVKVEKAQAQFEKLVRGYAKPWDPTKNKAVDADFSVFNREILNRIGYKTGMSVPGLAQAIQKSGFGDLAGFVNKIEKQYEVAGLELPVPDFLMAPGYRKPLAEMTVEEAKAVMDAVKSIDKIGRTINKVVREGEAQDKAGWVAQANQQIKDKFSPITTPATPTIGSKVKHVLNTAIAASTNNETLMSRFDGRDPKGIFTTTISYPAAEAANYEARLQRETAQAMAKLGEIKDPKKVIQSPFIDPLNKLPMTNFTRKNLMAVVSNMGNDYNWKVLAKGWGLDPDLLWKWVEANTTVEDIQRAQDLGGIFKGLKDPADTVYRSMYGVAPENIVVRPFMMHGKQFDGWYHPIIGDPARSAKVNNLEVEDRPNFWPSPANPYMKRRTGQVQVIDLSYDSVPMKLGQVIHDIAFREPVNNITKIFKDRSFRETVTGNYGLEYMREMDDWLKRIAGIDSYNSAAMALANKISGNLRQNVITTQIAFNLGTVEKHGATAWLMSARELDPNLFKSIPKLVHIGAEVGLDSFRHAVMDMFGKSQTLGDSLWQFSKENSEELQRRERNYQDTMMGQQNLLEGKSNIRALVAQYGAKLVAFSDMLSAQPLWLAKYREVMADTGVHGDAVAQANQAVRRAHGSTAVTNLPRIATGNNPVTPWMTSLYGFMGTSMQRRIEIFHDINDAYKLGMAGDINGAAKMVPQILSSFAVYVLWTGIVEEAVTSQFTDDHRGVGERTARFAFGTAAQSIIGLRDLVHDIANGTDSGGLISTPIHDVVNFDRDLQKHNPLSKEHAGKLVQDGITAIGDLTGVGPKHIGTAARYGIDAFSGFQHPRTIGDVYRGTVSGQQKLRVVK